MVFRQLNIQKDKNEIGSFLLPYTKSVPNELKIYTTGKKEKSYTSNSFEIKNFYSSRYHKESEKNWENIFIILLSDKRLVHGIWKELL